MEAKEEQKRAFEALEDDEEQAPPPKPRKVSTTQVALNYVRWGHADVVCVVLTRDMDFVVFSLAARRPRVVTCTSRPLGLPTLHATGCICFWPEEECANLRRIESIIADGEPFFRVHVP